MSKKVLILKNAGATLFQQPDKNRPSAFELGRTLFGGKGTGKFNRLAAAGGLAAKTAALGGTVVGTAHEMQGGNLFSPLSAGYKYDAMDPSGKFLAGRVEAGNQGAEKFQSQQNQMPQSSHAERMGGYTTGSKPNQVGVRAKGPARFNVPKPGDSKPAKPEWMKQNEQSQQPTSTSPVNTAVPPGMPETVPQMAGSLPFNQGPNQAGPVVPPHQPATIDDGKIVDAALGLNQRINSPTNIGSNAQGMLNAQVYPQEPSIVQSSLNDYTGQQNTQQFNLQQPFNPSMLNQNQFPTPPPHSKFNPSSSLDPNILQQPQYHPLDINALDAQRRLQEQMTTKAYIKQLYNEFSGYLYKMTPHEAGQFAVYTMFTLRK